MTAAETAATALKGDTRPSLVALFFDQVAARGDSIFLSARSDGAWQQISWRETGDTVSRLARALAGLGIMPGDRVALIAENRPEWLIADMAIMAAGAITVPAYTTSTADELAYLLQDSGAVAALVSGASLTNRLLAAAAEAEGLNHVVTFPPSPPTGAEAAPPLAAPREGLQIHAWDSLVSGASNGTPPALPGPEDTACIIYTSGTGGRPKGVMLSHGAILANIEGITHLFRHVGIGDEVFLSFLPLSHSYEHTAGQAYPVSIGARITYAGGPETLLQDMADVRPSVMTAVPRLFEVFQARILAGLKRQPRWRQALFRRTLALGIKAQQETPGLTFAERLENRILDSLVRRKVRARFGGRLRFLISGGAPLNPDVGAFFVALGITVLQGYGQTEAAPVVSCNPPDRIRMDTVGPPFFNVECRIAEDGEILLRGAQIMQGYWNQPALTAETVRDGWLHTGDIGRIDEDGYLRITDRKKDIIVNSGGDNIAPQRVEGLLTLHPDIAQVMVYGDRRPHLVAVLVPEDSIPPEQARARIAAAVESVNQSLSPIEKVRRHILADAPFTIENGQMTPTLKIRRHIVRECYRDRLEALYR